MIILYNKQQHVITIYNKEIRMNIGLWLESKLRKENKSMTWLCEELGITQATPSRWKKGAYQPNLGMIKRIVNFISSEFDLDRKELWLEILEIE